MVMEAVDCDRCGSPMASAASRGVTDAVRAETVRTIIRVAKRFAGPLEALDPVIDEVLALAGALTGADRAYLFMLRDGGQLMDNTHEWCAPGVQAERPTLQGLRVDAFPWWTGRLQRGESIHIEDVQALPSDASPERQELERQGIRGATCVPVLLGGRLLGFVGFDNLREPRPWRTDETAVLAMIAGTLGHALERQRHERERERLEAELREAQRLESLGRLAGGIAHDFNNQLSAVINYIALARQGLEGADPRAEDLAAAARAAGKARALVQRLMVFSRERTGVAMPVDMSGAVRALQPLLEHAVGEGVRLEVSLAESVPLVEVNPGHLDQLVMSLVMNARDALGDDGGTVRVSVTEGRGGGAQLRVQDDGVGVPAGIARRVFEPYFTTKSPPEGAGLGLSTAHGIVKSMGGTIRLEPLVDVGTAAIVEVPSLDAPEPQPAPLQRAGHGRTVLLVEDEPMVRMVVRRLLVASGYTIIDVSTPEEAVALTRALPEPPSLVVSDVSLPGMPGPALLRQLREAWADVPTILISGYAGKTLLQLGVEPSEVPKVLTKPFSAEALLARLDEIFGAPPA
ncbi:MAG: hypothetical protein AMXMBFR64_42220 [Myxococcales bacterium]